LLRSTVKDGRGLTTLNEYVADVSDGMIGNVLVNWAVFSIADADGIPKKLKMDTQIDGDEGQVTLRPAYSQQMLRSLSIG
jgi:hypothetical protein